MKRLLLIAVDMNHQFAVVLKRLRMYEWLERGYTIFTERVQSFH